MQIMARNSILLKPLTASNKPRQAYWSECLYCTKDSMAVFDPTQMLLPKGTLHDEGGLLATYHTADKVSLCYLLTSNLVALGFI
jgi:hypothetical protein